jgi:hypothetical protein
MIATNVHPAIEDLVEFLAKLAPRKILEYKASSRSQERLDSLLEKNKLAPLSAQEAEEMKYYMMIEHVVRIAKARALQKLNAQKAA